MRVLVVEDEPKIASFVRDGLEENDISVDLCQDGDTGYELASNKPYDAIVLDIMLPGRDGLSILRSLREQKNEVPVILLTARAELSERLEGLNLGADDYLTKPFFVEELVARIRAIARRASGENLNALEHGPLTVDLLTRQLHVVGKEIELTTREFNLLAFFLRSPGRVLTRTQILEQVWGYHFDPGTNIVDVYVRRLRQKITPNGELRLFEAVRGVGYRLLEINDGE
ncbi:MAG: response regulator transcription factor [Planctomycetes bacterium]|nr:response regulator transcription factor [Planctomycetota bacterium]